MKTKRKKLKDADQHLSNDLLFYFQSVKTNQYVVLL